MISAVFVGLTFTFYVKLLSFTIIYFVCRK